MARAWAAVEHSLGFGSNERSGVGWQRLTGALVDQRHSGVNHFAFWQKPELFNQAMLDFLLAE